ncbi:MAG: flagellar hook protein FlgE [Proteobacteria bacterium]|nr:MAG: flagellar hook protein FlgE [Pseudomonadota bacterium]
MAFQQGLSGLNAASKALDVISNNVANGSNVGFKGGAIQFTDVYAAALNGAAAGVQVGIGTAVGAVTQQFSQGNITPTGNPLDVAINGAGFFRVSGQGAIAYTRNGQFDVDKNGYLVNASGYRLTGYAADNQGNILPSSPTDLQINTSDLQPQPSSAIALGLNLDSRATAPGVPFNASNPTTYNASTSVTVFDSLGNDHILSLYFQKTGGGAWDLYTQLDGGAATLATGSPSMTFDGAGALTSGTSHTLSLTIPATFGANSPQAVTVDFAGSTQYGSAFGVNRQVQDGYASGRLSGITIAEDGTMQGRYSNGQSRNLGQVVLANFASPGGLLSLGSNLWGESPSSGQPLIGAPGSGSLGQLSAGSVEESNVDLTAELVNMITQQRAYQANAQSIRTQDQILQTLVNLR